MLMCVLTFGCLTRSNLTVVKKCKEIIEEKICFQDEQRTHHDSLPEPVIIDLKEGPRLVSSHSDYILWIELHK